MSTTLRLTAPPAARLAAGSGWSSADTERMLLQAGFDPDSVLSTRANYLGMLLGEPVVG